MNGYGNSVFLRTAWEVSGGIAPVNTVAPAITGTAQEGQTVTCSTGTWTGTPTITYAFQWKRNGSNIGSATSSTYVLVTADVSQSITCQVTATNGSGSASATSNTITPTAAVDPDAQAFITAAAITDPTQQAAINTLVVDLKGYSIWTKMKAVYPFVTDKIVEADIKAQMKFNLKDPRDLDAAFRLTWGGGGSWSANGYTPNGMNAFANTYFNPIAQSSALLNFSLSFYSRTNSNAGNPFDIGNTTLWNAGYQSTTLATRYNNNNRYIQIGSGYNTLNAETDSRGFYCGGTNGTAAQILYKNGSNVLSGTSSQDGFANNRIYIGAVNDNGLANAYSNKQCAFAHIGNGLSPTEAANFYTAVQAFQTTLGRQV